MISKNAILGNWRTTVAGAVLAAAYYGTQNGTAIPTTKQEWMNAGVSALVALLGASAKDANVGTKAPGQ